MTKRDDKAEIESLKRGFKAVGDTLRRAAKNADALDLKPEVKAWLLDQFGANKPRTSQPVTDETLENTREVIRQQLELEQRTERPPISEKTRKIIHEAVREQWEAEHQPKPASGKNRHSEKEQRRRKSRQDGDGLPPH